MRATQALRYNTIPAPSSARGILRRAQGRIFALAQGRHRGKMQRHVGRRMLGQMRRLLSTETAAAPGSGPNHRSIMALDGNTIRPFVQNNAFVAPSASVIGSVVINDRSAVMYGAVVRGDLALIQIGALTVIGENSCLTAGAVADGLSPAEAVSSGLSIEPELFVGDYVFIGAHATLESCYLRGDNFVGAGATIEPGARLGRYAVVEAGSAVVGGTEIGDGEIWAGCPAVKVGELSDDQMAAMRKASEMRYAVTQEHMYEFLPGGTAYLEKEALERAGKLKKVEI